MGDGRQIVDLEALVTQLEQVLNASDQPDGYVLTVQDGQLVFAAGGGGGGFTLPANWTIDDAGNLTITDEESGARARLFFNIDRWIFQVEGQGDEDDDSYSVTLDALPGSGSDDQYTYDSYVRIIRDGGGSPNTLKVTGENGIEQLMIAQGGFFTKSELGVTYIRPATGVVPNFGGNGDLLYTFLNPTGDDQGNDWIVRYDSVAPNQELSVSEDVDARITTVLLATDGDSNNLSTGNDVLDLILDTGGLSVTATLADGNDGTGVIPSNDFVQDTGLFEGSDGVPAIFMEVGDGDTIDFAGDGNAKQLQGVDNPGNGTDAANRQWVLEQVGGPGAAVEIDFYFFHNTDDLANGAPLWDPTDDDSPIKANDLLLGIFVTVAGVFDGTTPKLDISDGTPSTAGWFAQYGLGPVDVTAGDSVANGGGVTAQNQESVPTDLAFSNLAAYIASPAVGRLLPAKVNSNPMFLTISQDGTPGGGDPGSTQGEVIVRAIVAKAANI